MSAEPNSPWNCPVCTFFNNPLFLQCEMCQTQRPEGQQPPPQQPQPQQQAPPLLPHPLADIDHNHNNNNNNNNERPPAENPLILPSQPDDVSIYLSTLCGSTVSPTLVPGIANLTRKALKMEGVHLKDHGWLMNAQFHNAVLDSIHKARRSSALFRDIVDIAVAHDEVMLELNCKRCGQTSSEAGLLHLNESCGHAHCGFCVRDYTLDLVQKLACNDIKCPYPECDKELQNNIIRQSLMPNEYDEYMKATMTSFIRQDSNIITCPNEKCSAVMNFDKQGKADIPEKIAVKTDDGKLLSKEAWAHYCIYRLRCRSCNSDLCASCKIMPYHTGFTCEGFKEYGASKHCRFCAGQLSNQNTAPSIGIPALQDVCTETECLERRDQSCEMMLECGHPCGGVKEEKDHLPCLVEDCPSHNVPQGASDLCNICWVEGLESAPTVRLNCGHAFHRHCVVQKIESRWPSVRITFGFLKCPLCPEIINHPSLEGVRKEPVELYDKIKAKSLFRLKVDGLENDDKLTNPNSKWYGNKVEFSMNSFAYYNCFKCGQAYFGGRRDCEQNADAEKRPRDEFICFDCADIKQIACVKPDHKEFHVYKCRFCCSIAVWFCWGTTHFCEPCHSDRPWERAKWARDKFKQCKGKEYCPLKIDHSPNGSEADCEDSLGCGMCLDEVRKREDEAKKEKDIDDELNVKHGKQGGKGGRGGGRKGKKRPKKVKKSGFFGVF